MAVVAVASGSPDLARQFILAASKLAGGGPFYVVSELPPPAGIWIPHRFERSNSTNLDRIRAELGDQSIRLCCVLLTPDSLFRPMRYMAFRLAPLRTVFFNENLDHFMLRPRSAAAIARHILWRTRNWTNFQFHPGGRIYTLAWRMRHPHGWLRPWLYRVALQNGRTLALRRPARVAFTPGAELPDGVSVVIPSRNGRQLLARALPLVLAQSPDQVIVVDNGSSDGTTDWLAAEFPFVQVDRHDLPLSFSAAANRGIQLAAHSHVCLLNNDMEVQPGFLGALRNAFDVRADLFCATAQIFFPEGQRREETGKAVMPPGLAAGDFPIRCPDPIEGETHTEVLYGSGGCSLYRTAMLRALGGFDESFTPAYVEDLDLGYRGWLAGGATVFVGEARVVHHHRSTTSKYFTPEQIESTVERNYFRFLASSIATPEVFRDLWNRAVIRNNYAAAKHVPPKPPMDALRFAGNIEAKRREIPAVFPDAAILALGSGEFARFPGRATSGRPRIVVASCYAPYPLSHGGAVRMYNLMRRAASHCDQVLVYFADELQTPPPELLALAVEVIVVRRRGTHVYSSRELPDVVQEFRSAAFGAVLSAVVRQYQPAIVQLEFTQLAQYIPDCAPAKTILVEHDITIDLYRQLRDSASGAARWEYDYQLARWEPFERQAWRDASCIVVMSERDRAAAGSESVIISNGVDTERFQPSDDVPEPGRLLFIGSFAHLPNVMAVRFFMDDVWPKLDGRAKLHVIAGAKPDYYLEFYKGRAPVNLAQPGVELAGFVGDVRPAYRRAQVVIAPLLASAGTNIKILEAMAMGKAIVSTPAGVHGLDLTPGRDFVLAQSADEMAAEVRALIGSPGRCREIGEAARATVLHSHDWDRIADLQSNLYERLRAEMA